MVHDDRTLQEHARQVGEALQRYDLSLAVAESCTGGLLAKILTDGGGASSWFERGLVVYSNTAKRELAGVPQRLIEQHGAVSQEVAEALALGVLGRAPVTHSVAVTGVAGPEGGTAAKPVGTVWIAWGSPAGVQARMYRFPGDRDAVRRASVAMALEGLLERCRGAA
ncbi:MAG: CinA family protein [Halorhodospira halophila]|uniref:CinA family protein n=1 Tax=Halorhodospira TaxID=85108 RepID=UPI001914D388|nr:MULTISPECIES: CinA family protein [Halorhodospira]MBK5943972.1 damage-inducible protein CinA [Halorhodospira halophila]MCC3750442.1 CinA family protein [Halorhodospira halophila]MCG5527914.1 CinA family protein [Halorhodospira halophila]MCG5533242.1 CinA family protein [Halorhodospira sp. 9621]MCG5536915.1 CinA family protein [Halorhodospira sp. 9622]